MYHVNNKGFQEYALFEWHTKLFYMNLFLVDARWRCTMQYPRGYYLKTDPDPIAMVIRVELVIHKPTETNAN